MVQDIVLHYCIPCLLLWHYLYMLIPDKLEEQRMMGLNKLWLSERAAHIRNQYIGRQHLLWFLSPLLKRGKRGGRGGVVLIKEQEKYEWGRKKR